MSLFLWFMVLVGVVAAVLNVKKKRSCFVIWSVTNSIWIIHNFRIGEYQQSASYIILLLFTIWGFVMWGKKE